MIKMTLAEAAKLLQLPDSLLGEFHGFSIDTRTLEPGNLFIALAGSKVDGHDFVNMAKEKGAAAALVTRRVATDLPQFIVEDAVLALGQLSAAWRNQFDIPFIAITGSNGKTTLKNMVAAICMAACANKEEDVLATRGSLNNHIGLPLTLGRLDKKQRYAVLEMGMNHFGEIEYLTRLTKPNVAAITNAAAAHLEGLGDVGGVARAKSEIFDGLQHTGTAVINRDDAFFPFWREKIGTHAYLTFGFHPDADIHVSVREDSQQQEVSIHTPKGHLLVHLPLLGRHNLLNAAAATACAIAAGIDLNAVKLGLEKIKPAPGRLEVHTLTNGIKVIDDTYNANPFSLEAAVATLAGFHGKKILVLGDMKELGTNAPSLHTHAGTQIRDAGIDYLFTYGELSSNAAIAFGEGAYHFEKQEELISALKPFLVDTTTVLVKGSRSMRMEKVVAGIVQ
jgi:UDP-N-acetylmuramoyl-tripeptide--D-alanyl-D-alanine ligase